MASSKLNASLCPQSPLCLGLTRPVHVTHLVSFRSGVSFHTLQPRDALREKRCGTASPCSGAAPVGSPAGTDLTTTEVATRILRISGSFRNFESLLIESLIFAFGRIPQQTPLKMRFRSLGWLQNILLFFVLLLKFPKLEFLI